MKNENLLSPEIRTKYVSKILDFALYDVENCQTLQNFDQIKSNTHCTFAKTSKLWGACDYDPLLSLETNIERFVNKHNYDLINVQFIVYFCIGQYQL